MFETPSCYLRHPTAPLFLTLELGPRGWRYGCVPTTTTASRFSPAEVSNAHRNTRVRWVPVAPAPVRQPRPEWARFPIPDIFTPLTER